MTSSSSQRFCLRWNNHQSNLLSVFDQLLHDESFVDVTLAVDGQLLKAHKMILSACSPYFQTLFVGHPDKHPIVILKDVPYADMRSLLDFMYRGEVSVDQDRLTAFLKVAESLRIKGLTEVNEERCDIPSIASSLLHSSPTPTNHHPHHPPPPHLHRIHHGGSGSHKRGLAPMAANPLLGSALTAPKRKRGRPRKLSGGGGGGGGGGVGADAASSSSSEHHLDHQEAVNHRTVAAPQHPQSAGEGTSPAHSRSDSPLLHHATQPELLEVNMAEYPAAASAAPPHPAAAHSPPPASAAAAAAAASTPRPPSDEEDEGEEPPPPQDHEDGDDDVDLAAAADHHLSNITIKEEQIEPMPSTSMNDSTGNFKPGSQDGERFMTPDGSEEDGRSSVSLALCDEITITVDTGAVTECSYSFLAEDESEEMVITPIAPPTSSSGRGNSEDEEDDEAGGGDDNISPVAALFGASGVHFLSRVPKLEPMEEGEEETSSQGSGMEVGGILARRDLLEYVMQDDGSVICKWCGEWLPSRTHWYRHKYKLHMSQPPSTANLIKCHKCNVFFKSRKGYVGHVSSRHATASNGNSADEATNVSDDQGKGASTTDLGGSGRNGANCVGLKAGRRNLRGSTEELNPTSVEAYEKQREREEKLVADIIDRVKRECEAQGSTVSRRGYSRRTTVMNS